MVKNDMQTSADLGLSIRRGRPWKESVEHDLHAPLTILLSEIIN
jgi:hypothetical protein